MKPKEQCRHNAAVNQHVAGRISTGGMPVMRVAGVLVCALWVVAMMTGAAGAGGPKIPPVGTWKVGLFPWSSSDTVDRTIAALPKDLEVLALQDIFLDEDGLKAFARALRRSYPFSYHVPPQTPPHDMGCAPSLPAETCAAVTGLDVTYCVPLLASSLLSCLVTSGFSLDRVTTDDILGSICGPMAAALLALDNQCPACLVTTAKENGGDGQQTFDTCLAQQGP